MQIFVDSARLRRPHVLLDPPDRHRRLLPVRLQVHMTINEHAVPSQGDRWFLSF